MKLFNTNSDIEELQADKTEIHDERQAEEDYVEDKGDEVSDNEDFETEHRDVGKKNNEKETKMKAKPLVMATGNNLPPMKIAKTPSTQRLVDEAIKQLNERTGSSVQAIVKFIMFNNPELVEKRLKSQIKRYIKNCVTDGTIVQIKRSFKLANKHILKMKQLENVKVGGKQGEPNKKEKVVKGKENHQISEKLIKEKALKKKQSSNGLKTKTLMEKSSTKAKPDVIGKSERSNKINKTNEMKKPKPKTTNKKSRVSVGLVLRPTPPRSKPTKNVKQPKKKSMNSVVENKSVNLTSKVDKATGRHKMKVVKAKKLPL